MAQCTNGWLRFSSFLLLAGFTTGTVAGNTYQWTDRHGQMHFGDNPPNQADSTVVRLPRPRTSSASGLRPGELATLQVLEQRADRQQRRARAARRESKQQLAAERDACRVQRELLQQAQGKDGFKKHAQYLRSHCW